MLGTKQDFFVKPLVFTAHMVKVYIGWKMKDT